METYNNIKEFYKTGKRGRPKNSIKEIDPEIDYAVVHKTRENGKIIKVERKIIFGNEKRINERLNKTPSKTINTSYIERSNLTLRQNDSNLQRKTLKFAKEMAFFIAKIAIIIVHYNFIKIHHTLSKNTDKSYTPRTPALVAGIIPNNWTILYAFQRPEIMKSNKVIHIIKKAKPPPKVKSNISIGI